MIKRSYCALQFLAKSNLQLPVIKNIYIIMKNAYKLLNYQQYMTVQRHDLDRDKCVILIFGFRELMG